MNKITVKLHERSGTLMGVSCVLERQLRSRRGTKKEERRGDDMWATRCPYRVTEAETKPRGRVGARMDSF